MHRPDPRQLQLPLDDAIGSNTLTDQPASNRKPNILRNTPDRIGAARPSDGSKPASPGKPRQLQLDEHAVEYQLRRSKRRTIGFIIGDDGLRVTAPRWVTIAAIEEAIQSKRRWILSQLNKRQMRLAEPSAPMRWQDGTIVPYLGDSITLRLMLGAVAPPRPNHATRELFLTVPDNTTEQQVSEYVREWLLQEAFRLFSERIPIYETGLGVACRKLSLSSALGRWGSCSPKGSIRLNWRLIHFPLELIDYVIVHELAHLREMNHGPRFWAAVASVFPDYEAAKNALREQASSVMMLF